MALVYFLLLVKTHFYFRQILEVDGGGEIKEPVLTLSLQVTLVNSPVSSQVYAAFSSPGNGYLSCVSRCLHQ